MVDEKSERWRVSGRNQLRLDSISAVWPCGWGWGWGGLDHKAKAVHYDVKKKTLKTFSLLKNHFY